MSTSWGEQPTSIRTLTQERDAAAVRRGRGPALVLVAPERCDTILREAVEWATADETDEAKRRDMRYLAIVDPAWAATHAYAYGLARAHEDAGTASAADLARLRAEVAAWRRRAQVAQDWAVVGGGAAMIALAVLLAVVLRG